MHWIGIDVGGTFTDAVVYDTGTERVSFAKTPSTPSDPSVAVLDILALLNVRPADVERFVHGLQWRGSHRAGEAFRTLMDSLEIDDAGWCFRTGPSGHLELRKTVKAVESDYEKGRVISALAHPARRDPQLREACLDAAETIDSEYEYAKVMRSLR